MLKININNVIVYTKPKLSILEVCQTIGIEIPRFCYHDKLSVAGNCRMCLVEIDKSPKPVVSCSMPVMNDIKIFTDTPLVKKARENVLELLLLNHPLDCPICDQGGECDLQDQALTYGSDVTRFHEYKRSVKDKNLGPLIKTIMTRCIHCTRCVRFAQEIAGVEDLGTLLRGTNTEIGTYVEKIFQSELSGNVIDLCPVGALTSKVYSFVARPWELKTYTSIDCSDSLGSNIKVDVKNNKIVRVLPFLNNNINEDWISDKTRFLFDSIFSNRKSNYPSIIGNTFETSNSNIESKWNDLFREITNSIYVLNHFYNFMNAKGNLLIIVGSNVDLETLISLESLSKQFDFVKLKKENSVHLNTDTNTEYLTSLSNNYLNDSTFCCLLGTNTRYESSVLNIKLRKRYLSGGFLVTQVGTHHNLTFPSDLLGLTVKNISSIADGTSMLCQQLVFSNNPIIIVGSSVFKIKNFSKSFLSLNRLKSLFESKTLIHYLHHSSNDAGFCLLSDLKSVSLNDFEKSKAFYFVENNFDEKIFNNLINMVKAGSMRLNQTTLFTLNQNTHIDYNSKSFLNNLKYNNEKNLGFLLPSTSYLEKHSHFCNTQGLIQKTSKTLNPMFSFKNSFSLINFFLNNIGNITFPSNLNTKSSKTIIPKMNFLSTEIKDVTNSFFPKVTDLFDKNLIKYSNLGLVDSGFFRNTSKLYNAKSSVSVDNFYTGGSEVLSKNSEIMIRCSRLFKINFVNFK